MTLHGTDLIVIAVMITAGFGVCYAVLLWKLRAIVTDRRLKVADQIGAVETVIRNLERRLAEHQDHQHPEASPLIPTATGADAGRGDSDQGEEGLEIVPEIQAAIAATAVAVLGENAVVQSVKAVPSAWTQQGRVQVHGGHNLRVRR
jgi:hypothetical protein